MADFRDVDLIKDEPFNDGDDWNPDLAYLALHPKFTNDPFYAGQYLSFLPALLDESLSDAADQLKARTYSVLNTLEVEKGSGALSVVVKVGGLKKLDGTPITKSQITLNVPDNTTTFVYADSQGNIQASPNLPSVRAILAKVVASGGAIQNIEDSWRSYKFLEIRPRYDIINIFGGNGAEGDYIVNAGETKTLTGYHNFRNLTVRGTLNITQQALLRCSGDVLVTGAGNFNVSPSTPGGAIFQTGTNGVNQGGLPGQGPGGGGGSSGVIATGGGAAYSYLLYKAGSGGGSGFITGLAGFGGITSAGGRGGGGLLIEAAGTITITNGAYINALGEDGTPGGGNVGETGNNVVVSGGGGGSGGLIYLASINKIDLQPGSILNVTGGNGAEGRSSYANNYASGGGGGGAGRIVLIAPIILNNGQTFLLGGSKGADSTAGQSVYLGGGRGGGFGGTGGQSQPGNPGVAEIIPNTIPFPIS